MALAPAACRARLGERGSRTSRRAAKRRGSAGKVRKKKKSGGSVGVFEAPPLEETLVNAFNAGVRALSASEPATASQGGLKWQVEESCEVASGGALYARYRIDGIPREQGQNLGNTMRRTLLRHDLFRSHAAVAFRLQTRPLRMGQEPGIKPGIPRKALHEFASLGGLHESMVDMMHNVQQMAVEVRDDLKKDVEVGVAAAAASEEVESWRWATRRCGPCSVQASDLDIVDSSCHFERPLSLAVPTQHLCRITTSLMFELEMDVVCCSQRQWEDSPVFQDYQARLRHNGWLVVPPLFSPVRKANYLVTADKNGDEVVTLEVWTRPGSSPHRLCRIAAASLLAALTTQQEQEPLPANAGAMFAQTLPPPASDSFDDGDPGSSKDALSDHIDAFGEMDPDAPIGSLETL